MIKKNRILLTLLVTSTLSGLMLSGCTTTQAENKTTSQNKTTQTATITDTATYGKVTAVDGNVVTLALGTMNQGGDSTPPDQNQTKPEDSGTTTPPEKPSGSNNTGTNSADTTSQATPPDGNQGTMPEMLTLTGDTTTITLSDSITLTKMSGQKPDQQTSASSTTTSSTATTADITVGGILKITYQSDGTTIDAIEIMTMPGTPTTTSN